MYKARERGTGRVVALKKVRFDTSESESVRFMAREIRILQRLDHPNVIRLDGIATASAAGLFSVPAIRARLLTGRNAAWAARYAEPARPTLVAVGAAHLVGEGSFLQALAQVSGRSVRRLV